MATALHILSSNKRLGNRSKDRQGPFGCPQLKGGRSRGTWSLRDRTPKITSSPRQILDAAANCDCCAPRARHGRQLFLSSQPSPDRRGQAAEDAPSQSRHVACQRCQPANPPTHERLPIQLIAHRQSPARGIANARSVRRPPPPRNGARIQPGRHRRTPFSSARIHHSYLYVHGRQLAGCKDVTVGRDIAPCVMKRPSTMLPVEDRCSG
jgi:hypothetical protein